MKIRIRPGTALSAIAVLCAVLPFHMEYTPSGRIVRLNQACGQATACAKGSAYICSTADGDKIGYKCTKGCEPSVE